MSKEKAKLFSFSAMLKEQERKAAEPQPPVEQPTRLSPADRLPPTDSQPPHGSLSPPDRQSPRDSQSAPGSLSPADSLAQGGSQPERQPPASQNDSLPSPGSQPPRGSLSAGDSHIGKESKGFLKIGNTLLDQVMPTLDPFEQAVFLQLYRLSHGFGKSTCRVSLPTLSARTNVKLTSLKAAITRLQFRGLIYKDSLELGFGKDQGANYWVSPDGRLSYYDRQPPPGRLSPGDPIKRTLKDNIYKDSRPLDLKPEEVEKSINDFRDLITRGNYTVEMVVQQFKAGYSEGDWQTIESALVQ